MQNTKTAALFAVASMLLCLPAQAQVCACSVLGDDVTGSTEIRAAAGETIALFIGGDLVSYIEHAPSYTLAHFFGTVRASRFATGSALFVAEDTDVPSEVRTVVVNPHGDTVVVRLPVALHASGQRVTVKQLAWGAVEVQTSVSPYMFGPENIDDVGPSYMLPAPFGEGWPAVTFESWAESAYPYRSGWIIVGAFP